MTRKTGSPEPAYVTKHDHPAPPEPSSRFRSVNIDMSFTVNDLQWLASSEGRRLLDETASMLMGSESEIRAIQKLRKLNIPPIRSSLLVKQFRLRCSALNKFARAESMLFDNRLLQQSTDERLASYKSRRFSGADHIADICCGLGGDAMGLVNVANVTAVDSSDIACFLANYNSAVNSSGKYSIAIEQGDAHSFAPDSDSWFHIDPDRRSSKSRFIRLQDFSPGIDGMQRMVLRHQHGGIKIAPASDLPDPWKSRCERQWIGDRHECKQQILWFGHCAQSGTLKSASAIDDNGQIIFEWCESSRTDSGPGRRFTIAPQINKYLYEPHATILAGNMTDSLAAEWELARIDHDVEYLTGSEKVTHGALSAFEVMEVMRLDRRGIRSALESLDCGVLEVKKRGVDHKLMLPYQQMKFTGRAPLVLFLTRCSGKYLAVIGKRLDQQLEQ